MWLTVTIQCDDGFAEALWLILVQKLLSVETHDSLIVDTESIDVSSNVVVRNELRTS